ncbi:hypothetical protein ACFL0L_01985 [Patescibacteria group bacterium]
MKEKSDSILQKSAVLGVAGLIVGLITAVFISPQISWMHHHMMDVNGHREEFMTHKESVHSAMLPEGMYACCLEKPCMYCIEKTPKHGEGAACTCLEDVVNGVHPCGECIGEIMEGHGNHYLATYFAKAIAEEVGEHHLNELREIISEKYDIALSDQL